MYIVAVAEAYERKAELGGGFRGAARHIPNHKYEQGNVRETLAEARNDAKRMAFALLGNTFANTRPGYVYGKSSWRCNFWR